MPLIPGTRLGPYEILAPIGAGGMGEVYRGLDTRLDRTVAVKVISEKISENPEARMRFEREARTVSSLSHPHICALHDIGQQDNLYYLVLEYLEGQTLAERLRKGPLPLDETLRCAIQIADALDKAHRQGVLHRDLKPGNIMLTKSGAKLLDFGLARSTGTAPAASSLTAAPTATSPLTAEGALLGTFEYMAPEQLEGKSADHRSDIFAFATVIYEMATGRRAFEGSTRASLIAAIMKEQPRPIPDLVAMTPPSLDRLVRTCLAKDPERRFQSVHDVLLNLQWIKEEGARESVPGPHASPHRQWLRFPWALAAASALVAVVLGMALMRRTAEEPRVVQAFIPPPEGTSFELSYIHPGPVAVSPDGRKLAFSAREKGDRVRLWVRDLDMLKASPLAGTEGAGYPFWSPDSRSLGFFAQGKLKRIDLDPGRLMVLCDAPIGKGGAWSRDGVILFAPSFQSGIHRVSENGGESIPVTELIDTDKVYSHRFPDFLPDGQHFLFVEGYRSEQERPDIMLGSLGGMEPRPILRSDSNAQFVSGHILYLYDEALLAQPFDAARLEVTGDAFRIVEGVAVVEGTLHGSFSASDQGVLAYRQSPGERTTELVWVDRGGEVVESLDKVSGRLGSPALSPDGKQVAVTIQDAPGQPWDLWSYDLATGLKTRLTFGLGPSDPVWSPSGDSIVFTASIDGAEGYYRISPGRSEVTPVDLGPHAGLPTSWSPDGRFIAGMAPNPDTGADIWILPLSGDRETYAYVRTRSLEIVPQFSPDGRWIAYGSNETGEFEVYVGSFEEPGRRIQISSHGGESPRWRSDSREVFYISPDRTMTSVKLDVENAALKLRDTEELFEVQDLHQGISAGYAVSPDGQRFLLQRRSSSAGSGTTSLVLVSDWRVGLVE